MFMPIFWNYFLNLMKFWKSCEKFSSFLYCSKITLEAFLTLHISHWYSLCFPAMCCLKPFSVSFLYSQSSHSKQILCLLVSSLWSVASSTTSLFSTGLSPDFSISSSQCVLDGGLAFFCRCSYRHLRFLFNDHWWSFNCGFLLARRRRIQAHGEREGVGLSLVGQVLAKIHKLSCQARQLTVAFHFQTNLN